MEIIHERTPFTDAHKMNRFTYIDYYNRLKMLALTMFKWENMPEEINLRYLEETLYYYGDAVFFFDEKLGFLGLKVTNNSKLNVYGEPIKVTAIGTTYNKSMEVDECVIIKNNPLKRPTDLTVRLFAQRLYEVERSLDVNVKSQKYPILIKGTQQQQLTLKNIYRKHDGNEPVIYVDKSLDIDALKVLNTGAPYVADKLTLYKHEIWNEAMSFLGISNANTDKKERLITDEVESNNQLIQLSADVMLHTRQQAAEEINKMYGVNVSVKLRQQQEQQPREPEPEPEPDEQAGGDDDE